MEWFVLQGLDVGALGFLPTQTIPGFSASDKTPIFQALLGCFAVVFHAFQYPSRADGAFFIPYL